MGYISASGDDAGGLGAGEPQGARIRRYGVPAVLNPEERFEHWRTWYGSAVDTPMRLEKVENSVHRNFNPTASSLDGPGFSIVELVNEPVAGYWNRDSCSGEIRIVHFKTSSAEFHFSGRSEVISPGTVRFLDLSSGGGFNAHAGLGTVQLNIDCSLLGLDEKSVNRLQRMTDIRENPLVRGLLLPWLSDWQRTGIEREVHRLEPVVRSMMAALTSSLLEAPAADDLKPARLAAVKKFIHRNYRNQDLDVDAVVAYSFLSRRALYYLFEDEHLPVNTYIRALRTLEALDLLTDPNSRRRSLAGIAEASGFKSLQAMRRAVKESSDFSLKDVQENPEALRSRAHELRKLIGT
ncbi:helix-turn-helix domain-containing protein [Arthrobacter sp. AFG20]|uniref:helix-turn-helix transcriptional regulator n=1 Tax=Arthrobacter sp. AFG20 TaxID=1688671 RepID=UPI000C9E9034|nr:helix-turn-helix domain-containing protein [Arthrobacter sp. AFG20]PNH85932.1 AraC family transcriptional regulator [Arthrobacter sp. AFG20]